MKLTEWIYVSIVGFCILGVLASFVVWAIACSKLQIVIGAG